MKHVDPAFPVFVLLGLLVGETYYARTLVPRVKATKVKHFGDADTVLHSYDIRKHRGPFQILGEPKRRDALYEALNRLFVAARIRLYAVAVDKRLLLQRYLTPLNPYDVSLSQLLSIVCGPPNVVGPSRPSVRRIIAESRGKVEDKQLQHEYQGFRVRGLANYGAIDVQNRHARTVQRLFPNRIDFVRKQRAVAGLELADLAAYPIARAVVNKSWDNPAAQVIAAKLAQFIQFP